MVKKKTVFWVRSASKFLPATNKRQHLLSFTMHASSLPICHDVLLLEKVYTEYKKGTSNTLFLAS